MSVVLPHRVINNLSEARTPEEFKSKVMEKIGDLSEIEIPYNQVLLATYVRPEKTKGGIIRTASNVEEDIFQGKVGLILKVGKDAFRDDGDYVFNGFSFQPGEWGVFKVGDAWSVSIKDVPCRIVRDTNIRLKIKTPDIVF